MTRREMLSGTGSALAWLSMVSVPSQAGGQTRPAGPMLKNMGGEPPGFGHRNRAGGFDILEHCRSLGLGAVRMNLPSTDLEVIRALRKKLGPYADLVQTVRGIGYRLRDPADALTPSSER